MPTAFLPALSYSSFIPVISRSHMTRPDLRRSVSTRFALSRPRRPALRMAIAEDPVAVRVREELAADGINIDELLNAGKVISLTRKLDTLTEECSALASDSPEYLQAQKKIEKIQVDLVREKRQVMQQWLKQLFAAQAVLFVLIGGILSSDNVPGFSVPLVGQALGFWTTWLFSIPALRARKGTAKWEKSALNVAFLATPTLNLLLPFLTKNCATIWAADVAVLLGCYVYYASAASRSDARSAQGGSSSQKETGRVKGILKYLDWGSWR